MSLEEFIPDLFSELENELSEIDHNEKSNIQRFELSSKVTFQTLIKLKSFVVSYKFLNKEAEIDFFKNIKPQLLGKLIYYRKAFQIQTSLPFSSFEDQKEFYLKELNKINDFQKDNKEFISYYKSYSTVFDEVYFTRKEPDSWLLLNFDSFETDPRFATLYDLKISKIIAFKLLGKFIRESINKIDARNGFNPYSNQNNLKLKWTGSKVSLIELLYALQSSGSFNNGALDLKNLASAFEGLFQIDLGNYYRVFQEIRIRKQSRTTFLDKLKNRLIKRMDEADENPKFS